MRFKTLLATVAAGALLASQASAIGLSVGSGDGSLFVDVDPFGTSRTAEYDPVGAIGQADTFFDSYIAINNANGYQPLDEFDTPNTDLGLRIIDQTDTSLVSAFSINFLDFQLTQSVAQTTSGGAVTGAMFTQSLSITNPVDPGDDPAPVSFQLRRYLDGDLDFDGTLIDGGGVLQSGTGRPVLFEIDSTTGDGGDNGDGFPGEFRNGSEVAATDDSQGVETTFVGITATGGTIPANGSFEVSQCCDSDVRSQLPLSDMVENDFNGDGFIDDFQAYDVKLVLQNDFNIPDGQTQTYVTTTIFGNADFDGPAPVQPGAIESLPLLPDDDGGNGGGNGGGFRFTLPADAITERQTIFIDPEMAIGYSYMVEGGSDFYSVTAPTFGAVPDPDGYTLVVDGMSFAIASGVELIFEDLVGVVGPVYAFSLTGIDPSLMLDPADPLAFVTGISLQNVPVGVDQVVTQTPIVDTGPGGGTSVVPLPAAGWLLLSGLGGLVVAARRRA